MRKSFLLIAILLIPVVASASIEIVEFKSAVKEQLYMKLIDELRCLVCQNQNLADSNAELAQDMRKKTYEMVKSGASYGDVVNYMTQRYGDFVLFRPPFKSTTFLLWVGPYLIFFSGLFLMFLLIHTQSKRVLKKPGEGEVCRARAILTIHGAGEK